MLTASRADSPSMAGSSSAFSVESLVSLDPASLDLIKASTEPRWRQFLHFWLALASEKGDIPARGDLDPARLGTELLPNVFLVDVVFSESDKPRFRFRLLGEAIQERETTRVGDFLDGLVDAADRATIERITRRRSKARSRSAARALPGMPARRARSCTR